MPTLRVVRTSAIYPHSMAIALSKTTVVGVTKARTMVVLCICLSGSKSVYKPSQAMLRFSEPILSMLFADTLHNGYWSNTRKLATFRYLSRQLSWNHCLQWTQHTSLAVRFRKHHYMARRNGIKRLAWRRVHKSRPNIWCVRVGNQLSLDSLLSRIVVRASAWLRNGTKGNLLASALFRLQRYGFRKPLSIRLYLRFEHW